MIGQARRRQSGQSLIEVSLAVAVLAFGLAGLARLTAETQRAAGQTRASWAAEQLAMRHAEQLRGVGFRGLIAYLSEYEEEGLRHIARYPLEKASAQLEFGARAPIACEWQAEIEQSPSIPGSLHVSVAVEWQDSGGAPRRAERTIYVFE